MTDHSFSVDSMTLQLERKPLEPKQVVEGNPQVSSTILWRSDDGRQQRGVWQITRGVVTDVEADEIFVVVAGRATVEIQGQSPLQLAPGFVGILRAGDRSTWHVHETLRKVYHLTR
jgi:uncharacterized cupin superfamily protein